MKVLSALQKVDNFLVRITRHIIAIIMLFEALMLFVGAVARYLFNHSIMWIDELASYFLVLLTLFGCYAALYEDKLAAVTFIVDGLPNKLRKAIRILAAFFSIVLLLALAYFSFQLCLTPMIVNTVTPILRWSKLYFYAMLPLLSTIMAFHQVLKLIEIVLDVDRGPGCASEEK